MNTIQVDQPSRRSPSAARMRLCRERRRRGLRCVMVELREGEIESLIRAGLLHPSKRGDQREVVRALYGFLDRTLGKPK